MTKQRESLNSRNMPLIQQLQATLDAIPQGPEHDHHQGIVDRMIAKLDAFPARSAARLVGVADREERLRILTEECEHIVSEMGGKYTGN